LAFWTWDHNNEKTFLVWVNKEGQLRIISMQKGADIGAVFERFSRAQSDLTNLDIVLVSDGLELILSC
jgi:hypothetical protein